MTPPTVDVFIPFHEKDEPTLRLCIKAAWRYLRPRPNRVVVVTGQIASDIKSNLRRWGATVLDESSIPGLLSRAAMPKIMVQDVDRTGWYFQQFIKWGVRTCAQTPCYVVLDADTILIRPVILLYKGKQIFHRSRQYHQPYFLTYEKLLGYAPEKRQSFIVNYMMLNCEIIDELTRKIEPAIPNKGWVDAILGAISHEEPSSFSEFETYGYFVSDNYPHSYCSVQGRNVVLPTGRLSHHWYSSIRWQLRGYNSISYHNYNVGD